MTIFSQTLFTLVGGNFMPFALFTTGQEIFTSLLLLNFYHVINFSSVMNSNSDLVVKRLGVFGNSI
jgi:hypothetical protein